MISQKTLTTANDAVLQQLVYLYGCDKGVRRCIFVIRKLKPLGYIAKLISLQLVLAPSLKLTKTTSLMPRPDIHRIREALIRESTKATNLTYGFLMEFDIRTAEGIGDYEALGERTGGA